MSHSGSSSTRRPSSGFRQRWRSIPHWADQLARGSFGYRRWVRLQPKDPLASWSAQCGIERQRCRKPDEGRRVELDPEWLIRHRTNAHRCRHVVRRDDLARRHGYLRADAPLLPDDVLRRHGGEKDRRYVGPVAVHSMAARACHFPRRPRNGSTTHEPQYAQQRRGLFLGLAVGRHESAWSRGGHAWHQPPRRSRLGAPWRPVSSYEGSRRKECEVQVEFGWRAFRCRDCSRWDRYCEYLLWESHRPQRRFGTFVSVLPRSHG